jgi:ADP-ribosyl-[dinitrogen reductase] hydrolase
VNLGEDADTTGAIYGQLAGAYYGARGIPKRWIERLARRRVLDDMAARLASAAFRR